MMAAALRINNHPESSTSGSLPGLILSLTSIRSCGADGHALFFQTVVANRISQACAFVSPF